MLRKKTDRKRYFIRLHLWLPDILFLILDYRDISIRGSRLHCIRIVTDCVPYCEIEFD